MNSNQGFKAPNTKMVSGTQVLNGAGLLIASKEKPWSERKTVPGTILTARALQEHRASVKEIVAAAKERCRVRGAAVMTRWAKENK